MSPLNAAIYTTISYTLWVEWYYLKNNYLTLRSKVTVPRRSLQYATHRLMVMHPHTKYHWPISKDKQIMVRTSFAEKKRKRKKKSDKNNMSPFVRRGDIIMIPKIMIWIIWVSWNKVTNSNILYTVAPLLSSKTSHLIRPDFNAWR
jgi:hypothetical protein